MSVVASSWSSHSQVTKGFCPLAICAQQLLSSSGASCDSQQFTEGMAAMGEWDDPGLLLRNLGT